MFLIYKTAFGVTSAPDPAVVGIAIKKDFFLNFILDCFILSLSPLTFEMLLAIFA